VTKPKKFNPVEEARRVMREGLIGVGVDPIAAEDSWPHSAVLRDVWDSITDDEREAVRSRLPSHVRRLLASRRS